jgi:hypothetical protein
MPRFAADSDDRRASAGQLIAVAVFDRAGPRLPPVFAWAIFQPARGFPFCPFWPFGPQRGNGWLMGE